MTYGGTDSRKGNLLTMPNDGLLSEKADTQTDNEERTKIVLPLEGGRGGWKGKPRKLSF